jgi:hypothetical protein
MTCGGPCPSYITAPTYVPYGSGSVNVRFLVGMNYSSILNMCSSSGYQIIYQTNNGDLINNTLSEPVIHREVNGVSNWYTGQAYPSGNHTSGEYTANYGSGTSNTTTWGFSDAGAFVITTLGTKVYLAYNYIQFTCYANSMDCH